MAKKKQEKPAPLTERLLFFGTRASESETMAAQRRVAERKEAARVIARLVGLMRTAGSIMGGEPTEDMEGDERDWFEEHDAISAMFPDDVEVGVEPIKAVKKT